jgi:UDP-glucose 4-epimerase
VVQGLPLQVWGDGSVVRDYLYVKDAVSGLRQLLLYQGPERIFNVSSNRGYSVNEVIEELQKVTGKKLKVAYSAARKFDVRGNILSNALARRELSWKPAVNLHEGISRVYQWLIREGKE